MGLRHRVPLSQACRLSAPLSGSFGEFVSSRSVALCDAVEHFCALIHLLHGER